MITSENPELVASQMKKMLKLCYDKVRVFQGIQVLFSIQKSVSESNHIPDRGRKSCNHLKRYRERIL